MSSADCHDGASAVAEPPGGGASARRLVALVGPPNAGKSTLFNRLTGMRQKVANYPGVTVEKKTGLGVFGGRGCDRGGRQFRRSGACRAAYPELASKRADRSMNAPEENSLSQAQERIAAVVSVVRSRASSYS